MALLRGRGKRQQSETESRDGGSDFAVCSFHSASHFHQNLNLGAATLKSLRRIEGLFADTPFLSALVGSFVNSLVE
jgi:hypothetical protein